MKTQTKKIAIVGGCGHVGLPLGIALAQDTANEVVLIDLNAASVESVNAGHIHFVEHGGEALLKTAVGRNLRATLDKTEVQDADYVVFVTGTPVDSHLNPCISEVIRAIDQYLPMIPDSALIVLRSTLYPGTTELVRRHLDSKQRQMSVVFCPERVAQGHAVREIHNLPQIVAAFDKESEDRAAELFSKVAPEIIRLTVKEAELTKLFANSWRYIEFAIANQHYMIAEANGADFQRIYQALTYHYPRAKTFFKAGFTAGPCLFKDTMQLSAFTKNTYFLGHAAMLVNEGLPDFVVTKLEKQLGTLEGKKIGLLGMAFKPDNDDTRDSLSYKVKKTLINRSATVIDTDPFQPSASRLQEILDTCDAFVLGVPHSEYRDLDMSGKAFVDCWGVWNETPNLMISPFEEEEEVPFLRAA